MSALRAKIKAEAFNKEGGGLFLSGALKAAESEFSFSKSDTPKILISIIAAGKPINPWATKKEAKRLKRKHITLITIPIENMPGGSLRLNDARTKEILRAISSRKYRDNTEPITNWKDLIQFKPVETLVTRVCKQGDLGFQGPSGNISVP